MTFTPANSKHQRLNLVAATADDLDHIMALERQGFAPDHQEARAAYAQRIATFPQGSLMAWRRVDCVGCVFSEIWRATVQPATSHFTLGHDIRARHDPVLGTELYISSMTLAPAVRGMGLGAPLLLGCLEHVAQAFPHLQSALLLVNAAWMPARRIYAGVGFEEIACLPAFFASSNGSAQDGIVMRMPIQPRRLD